MASTTTLTPTTDTPPKLLKKAADAKNSTLQTTFGCQHIKGLLQVARQPAVDGYTKLIASLRKEGNVSDRIYKSAGGAASTSQVTYLCLQCPNVSISRDRHHKAHGFSVESTYGYVWCHECRDFVYDPTFEVIRAGNNKKRKHAATLQEGDKKLMSNNASATSCAATGLRGLYNMGQTCFMSVILQSLIHNPFIRTFYLAEGHKSSECEREACTSCALDDIFTDFYGTEKHEGYGAVHMLQGCWKGGGGLAGYSQQDAHEYLGFILNSLHEANTDEEDKPECSKDDKDCQCIVHSTFGGLMKSTVTCDDCKNTTTALEPFRDLSVDIRTKYVMKEKKQALTNTTTTIKEALPMDLTECLEHFTGTETLTSDSYRCRKCDAARSAKKKLTLTKLPPVIPVHLKRFSHSKAKGQSNKVDSRVRFPLTLDMTPFVVPSAYKPGSTTADSANGHDPGKPPTDSDEETIEVKSAVSKAAADNAGVQHQPVYHLSSVIVHKGKIDNGHYISYSQQEGDWFRFDDSMVVQVEEKEVLNAEAYMLFYIVAEF